MTERIAIYAGSFDPLTNGHLDVLKASLAVADIVYRRDRHPSGQEAAVLLRGAGRS